MVSAPPSSPPPSPPPSASHATLTTHALSLSSHQRALESILQSLLARLRAAGAPPGVPLTDAEGFPRADIEDLPGVAMDRQRVVVLGNDLREVNRRLGRAVERVHAAAPAPVGGEEERVGQDPQALVTPSEPELVPALAPFARIDGVAPNSPAAAAGLQRADLLLRIGSLTSASLSLSSPQPNGAAPTTTTTTTSVLAPLAPLVAAHENRPLELVVRRPSHDQTQTQTQTLTLTLIPRAGWGGRGLLGCHIVPYTPASVLVDGQS